MLIALVLSPLAASAASFLLRANRARLALLIGTALVHAGLTAACWSRPPAPALAGWLAADALGLLILTLVSALFLCAALYSVGYLRHEPRRSNRVFVGCLLAFLASMSLVTLSRHFGLLWVAIEATTLTSAPLIYFHHSQSSLEATWKYLLICSVGIALALLGTFFLAAASTGAGPEAGQLPLLVDALVTNAARLQTPWLKGAFLLFLVGYGTKMGLAPFHTWLPDAHGAAPAPASALLSGALLNCAFLGPLRLVQVCGPAGLGPFAGDLLVVFGLLSLAVAAVFIVGQVDYKRLLAYSSVEHMGILSLGVGLGGAATYGAMLHAVNHSLAKALLFLVAGNILLAYGTTAVGRVRGMLKRVPVSGVLFAGGFLAIVGSPPFGPFLSEFMILNAAIAQGRFIVAGLYVFLLAIVFLGMGAVVLPMLQGDGGDEAAGPIRREPWLMVGVPMVLLAFVLLLGLYVPPALTAALQRAAALVRGAA